MRGILCKFVAARIHCELILVATRLSTLQTRSDVRVGIVPLTLLLLRLVGTGLQHGWRGRLQKGQLLVQHSNIFQLFLPNLFTPLQTFLLRRALRQQRLMRLKRWSRGLRAGAQRVQFVIGRCECEVAFGDLQRLFRDLLLRCSELRPQRRCAGGGGRWRR